MDGVSIGITMSGYSPSMKAELIALSTAVSFAGGRPNLSIDFNRTLNG